MITAYYSSVLDDSIKPVWSLIRDFNNYPAYIEGVTESMIEDDKAGDEVGAVRRFKYDDIWIRQRLAAHSDEQRFLTYASIDQFTFPPGVEAVPPSPIHYEGTIRLFPIVDGDRTFIEWYVHLDALPEESEKWHSLFLSLIPIWTESLRRTLANS